MGWFLVPLRARGRALPKVTPWHPQHPPPPGPGFHLRFHLSATSGCNTAGVQGAPSPAQQQGPAPQHPFVCSSAVHAAAQCLMGTKPPIFTTFSGTSVCDVPRGAVSHGGAHEPCGIWVPREHPGPRRVGTCRRGSRCHQEQTSKRKARSQAEASGDSRGVVQL